MRVLLNRNFKWSEYGGYKCYRIELQKFPNKWFVSSERILVSGQKHQIQFQPRQKDGDNKTQQEFQTKNWLSGSGRNQGQWGRDLECQFYHWKLTCCFPKLQIPHQPHLTSFSESSYDMSTPIILSLQVRKVRPQRGYVTYPG